MTSQQEILQRLCAKIAWLVPDEKLVHPDVDLVQELGFSSIEVMNMLMEIEDEFDISVPLNVLAEVRTPAQLARAVSDLLEARDGSV